MLTVLKEMKVTPTKGDIGVEIEVEGHDLPQMAQYWNNERDGSLQGESFEYVLKKPLTLPEVSKALAYMKGRWKATSATISNSIRAGVHIHINCQELSIKELYNYICLYLILENVLTKYCGPTREGNLFCLRAKDAEYLIHTLVEAVRSKDLRGYFPSNNLRYAAINVKALGDYGSLEFRAMRSDGNLDLIYSWAELLYNMREHARKINDPRDLITEFSTLGATDFLAKYAGKLYKTFCNLYAHKEDMEKDLYEGMRIAQDVAFCIPDWNGFVVKVRTIGQLDFDAGAEPFEPEEDF